MDSLSLKYTDKSSPEDVWNEATRLVGEHPYLRSKQVQYFNLRINHGNLVVPCADQSGDIKNLQLISSNGQKEYFSDTGVAGLYHRLGPKPTNIIYLCHDYASAASVHMATGKPVANVLEDRNLPIVTKVIRDKFPKIKIVWCCESVLGEDGELEIIQNTSETAHDLGCLIARPQNNQNGGKLITFNDLHQEEGLEALEAQLLKAERLPETPQKPPLPLRRTVPKGRAFPLNHFPPTLKAMSEALSETTQAPDAVTGQCLLASAALATQGHSNVTIDGREIPLSLFHVTIAASGERKSAVDRLVLKPHHDFQKAMAEALSMKRLTYDACRSSWKKSTDLVLQTKDLDPKKREADMIALGPEPAPPLDPIFMTEEPTYEGLVKLLESGQPSIGIFSDEGGRFLGGYAMSDQNQLKTSAGLSKLWDGDPITRTRSMDGSKLLYGRRCSMHLMIQPELGPLLYGSDLLIGQGLLSRCLFAYPTSNIGKRLYRDQNIWDHPGAQHYAQAMKMILGTPLPIAAGHHNELTPRLIYLTSGAKEDWIAYHDQIEGKCLAGGPLEAVSGVALKSAEMAARIAGVFSLIDDVNCTEVSAENLNRGILFAEYYLAEALRLFHTSTDSQDLILAEKCLLWMSKQEKFFSTADLYQKGPPKVRSKKTAERILRILENHNRIQRVRGGMQINGSFRSEAWAFLG